MTHSGDWFREMRRPAYRVVHLRPGECVDLAPDERVVRLCQGGVSSLGDTAGPSGDPSSVGIARRHSLCSQAASKTWIPVPHG